MLSTKAYYNEFDVKAAAWLRELIKAGHIAPGDVDHRSIEDVVPSDLDGYAQCHFFAGIGGWSYALRLAGWPDDRPVWTGSCPCQPFSAAGKGGGFADERHLWPAWLHLIRAVRPPVVFGEQVANVMPWIDLVSRDLEKEKYALGFAVLGAHSVGAPHIRQRLYFVADCNSGRLSEQRGAQLPDDERPTLRNDINGRGALGELADSPGKQPHGGRDARRGRGESTDARELVHADNEGSQRRGEHRNGGNERLIGPPSVGGELEYPASDRRQQRRPESGRWSAPGGCEYLPCTDGKARPVEPGTFPLAHGVPGRVGLLRGYGNAIVPQVAAEFIGAYLTC